MKSIPIFLCVVFLVMGCSEKEPTMLKITPVMPKLLSEEYFTRDVTSYSGDGFLPSSKKIYQYDDKNNLTAIYTYEFNSQTNVYDDGFKSDEFYYNATGQLDRSIEYLENGVQWIELYEYLTPARTKVTRNESFNGTTSTSSDWWTMDRTASSLSIKYYQLNDQLYQQLDCDIDQAGNITRVVSNPALSVGTIQYSYDHAPNPYQFQILAGRYFSTPKYFSTNNVVEATTELSSKLNLTLEYNESGYPTKIVTESSKRVFEYR